VGAHTHEPSHSSHHLIDENTDLDAVRSANEANETMHLPEEEEEQAADSNVLRPLSTREKRKKIGKVLQLALLRKYVACAKQLGHIPDRVLTEQILEEGYEEYFFQGGNMNEPRLGYSAFLKLVRNRRGEVVRQLKSMQSHPGKGMRCLPKEQVEIRTLIEELEQVRQVPSHSHTRNPNHTTSVYHHHNIVSHTSTHLQVHQSNQQHLPTSISYEQFESMLQNEAAMTRAAGVLGASSSADDVVVDGITVSGLIPVVPESSTMEHAAPESRSTPLGLPTAPNVASGAVGSGLSSRVGVSTISSGEEVLISRDKLDQMLRFAQETLATQKKILEQVEAIERRLQLR
jgi:hypothetical protein